MSQVIEIDELDAGQCLATFGHLRSVREGAERDILLLCAHFADLYDVASRADAPAPGRGRERPVRLGGTGTPLVWEFAVTEAAAELATTSWSARRLMADALDVRHRLPRLWRGLAEGSVVAGLARKVAQATRDLTVDQAATVDERIVGYADGRLPFSRFMARLEGLVVAADPAAAAERERQAREEEFARVGQSNDHGQRTLYVRTGAAQMARIDATIAFYADALAALGDADPVDKRRSKAVLLLANPTQAVALLQALSARRGGQTQGRARASAGGASGARDSADDGAGADAGTGAGAGDPGDHSGGSSSDQSSDDPTTGPPGPPPPPPPPPEWDELDLDLPPENPDAPDPGAGPPEDGDSGPNGAARHDDTADPDDTDPPDSAEAFLQPFFTRFRPTTVPPCACQGGGFLLDAAAMLPSVTLYLHGHLESLARGDGVVRWEGVGPITGDYLRRVLGPHARFTVKPVVDPQGIPPADGYEVPDAMAEALHVRTPFDVFPFGSSTGRDKQKDHTVAFDFAGYEGSGDVGHQPRRRRDRPRRQSTGPVDGGHPEGQTGLHNLGGMTTFHHRVKTHGRWQVRQPFPGVYLWRSPHGSMFYVDNTGTRQLAGPRYGRTTREHDTPVTPEGTTFRTPVADVLQDESGSIAAFRRCLDAS